ncbi:zinc-binding alcohol dehydrogenase [Pseudohyphozyma bogoriensis]|nr:zinc-binding alcohol dehydrogenase [Pseudohyphozyma bogoriensis]
MKGFTITRHIKLPELPGTLVDSPDPTPSKDEIVVDIYATALNFFDILQVQGLHQSKPPHPYVAGAEFAGIVSKSSPIPAGCSFVPGKTRVFGSGQGAFADTISVPWKQCLEIPDGLSMEEASGLSVTFPTSYAALVNRASLQPGETLLVHAAAGGVGLAALQIGKALGATVIATAGTPEKLDVAKRAGADYVLDYTKEGWQKECLKLTKGKGVDVVYDPVGMAIPSLKCIAWNGRVVIVGFAAGSIEKIPANLILLKNIAVTGVFWGAYAKNEPEAVPVVWKETLELFKQKKVKSIPYKVIYDGLDKVPEGLRALGARETWGKVVVRVRKEEGKSKL